MNPDAGRSSPENPHPLDGLGLQIKAHWRHYRPKMYRALEESGELDKAIYEAQERTHEALNDLVQRGMDWNYAWEAIRQEWAFLPEEDEENQPQPDPVILIEQFERRQREAERAGAPLASTSLPTTERPRNQSSRGSWAREWGLILLLWVGATVLVTGLMTVFPPESGEDVDGWLDWQIKGPWRLFWERAIFVVPLSLLGLAAWAGIGWLIQRSTPRYRRATNEEVRHWLTSEEGRRFLQRWLHEEVPIRRPSRLRQWYRRLMG